MRKFIVILFLVSILFAVENICSQLGGRLMKPNLLVVLIVFLNLARGTRYSLIAAVLGGLVTDCFHIGGMGINTFSFLSCALLTTWLKMYIYQAGSNASKILIVFLITIINIMIQFGLRNIFFAIELKQVFLHILIPEVLLTTIVTIYVFDKLKICVSRLSV